MAFHHHHNPAAACYCHCCYATYTPCHHHNHHPPPPPPPECYLYHPSHQPHLYADPSLHLPRHHDNFQQSYFQEKTRTQPTVSSLLRRIAALESALLRRASATSSSSQSHSESAARTIQTHFRAFLLRRSITLRQLKDLASIKSTIGFLKSSVSEKTHLNYDVLYEEAMNLLLKLESIRGGDPMVRNGKISLIRELNKILDFVDGICVERGLSSELKSRVSNIDRKFSNVKCGESKRVDIGKLRGLVERVDKIAEELDEEHSEIGNPNDEYNIRKNNVFGNRSGGLVYGGIHPKVKKNVSFADYCNDDSTNRGSLVNSAERELASDDCREIEEIDDGEDESSSVGTGVMVRKTRQVIR